MFYKFISVDSAWKYDVFIEGQTYFAKPSQLNDPFELKPRLTGLESLKQRKEYAENYIRRSFSDVGFKKKAELLKMLLKRLANPEQIEADMHATLDEYGIYCVASNWDKCLMWSHYSKAHTGFCIGLELDKEFDNEMGMELIVNYSKHYPQFGPEMLMDDSDDGAERLFQITVGTKSDEWKYEKEHRYIKLRRDGGYGKYSITKDKIKEVILGARISQSDKQDLIGVIKTHTPWVRVYEAQPKLDEFRLTRRQLIP